MQLFIRKILPPLLVLVLAAVILQLIVRLWHLPAYVLPAPSDIARALVVRRVELANALWASAKPALIGFFCSMIFGMLAAIILSSSIWVRRAFYPYTVFFQTVPIIAIAPLLVLWLNPGLPAVATSAFIVSVFPVIASTLSGLLSTDPALVDLFRLYGAGPIVTLWKLRLPAALPDIITGLRVAAGLAVIGTVVSEILVGILGNEEGIGIKITSGVKNGHYEMVFAGVLLVSLLGLTLFAAVNFAGHWLLRRWHVSERE